MRLARRSAAAFFLLAPIAAGQNPPSAPTEVTDLKLSDQPENEIRIELSTTGYVASAEVVATYRDSLVLDLPGAVYRALPRRVQVNHAGIRAVRLWMQSENPPLTRVVVEIDRTEQYLLSSDGNSVVLRVGPVLEGASPANTPNTAEVYGSRKANPAARGTASSSVAGAVSAIFRRGPGKPIVYKGPKIGEPGQSGTVSAPRSDGSAQAAKSDNPSVTSPDSALPAGQESSAARAQPLDATPNPALESSQNPPTTASATTIDPAGLPVADSPVVAASKEAKSRVVVLNRFPGVARDENSSENLSAAPAKDIVSVTSALPPT